MSDLVHRVACGDCRDPETVKRLLDGRKINLAFTSPPYADRRDYDASSGFRPVPPEEYVEWFAPVAANVAEHLADDGSWFVNIKAGSNGLDMDLYVLDLVLAHAREWGWHVVTEFCWERAGLPQEPNGRFKNQFEPIYQFARGKWKHRPDAVRVESQSAFGYGGLENRRDANDQGTGRLEWKGSFVGPGLAYPGNRLPTFSGSHEALGHSAAFPVGLPEWFIQAYSDPGDVVYDPFFGSGSTLIAAERQGRVCFGLDIAASYVDIACRRYQTLTSNLPVLDATNEAHDFLAELTVTPS